MLPPDIIENIASLRTHFFLVTSKIVLEGKFAVIDNFCWNFKRAKNKFKKSSSLPKYGNAR